LANEWIVWLYEPSLTERPAAFKLRDRTRSNEYSLDGQKPAEMLLKETQVGIGLHLPGLTRLGTQTPRQSGCSRC
jgi:hypothetical protein